MKERFEGDAGRRRLVEALKGQKVVGGNVALAKDLAELVEVKEVQAGEAIIHQGASDTDVYFILAGSFSILINGKSVAHRVPGEHIGEISALDPAQPRTATVVADKVSVVCMLSEPQLADIRQRYPEIGEAFAKELSRRLAQRNALISPARDTIRIFVICSVEALSIARELENQFAHDNFLVTVWNQGVFVASDYPIESLEKQVSNSDFAVAIAQPDDLTAIRGENKPTPRDNVIFEIGFCIGCLGRKRTLVLEPRSTGVKLPSDLRGMTTIGYRTGAEKDLPSLLAPACNQIRDIVKELGLRN